MADPTNPNDPTYSSDPEHYVYVNGRWQYRGSSASGNAPDSNANEHVSASTDPRTNEALAAGLLIPFAGPFVAGDIMGAGGAAGDWLAGGNPFNGTDEYYNATGQFDQWQNFFDSMGGSARPGSIALDTSNADASRNWQQSLIQDLQRQAAGDMNSRAQQSLAQGFAGAESQQRALGSAMRGPNGAAGLRAGMRGAGDIARGQSSAQQMLMLQEQQAAQAQLAQMLSQQRAQDAQGANAYSQNWLANNQTQNDWVNFMNQQGLGMALEGQQQQSELGRAILGTDVSNRDFAQRVAGQGAQALATMIDAGGQASGGGGSSASGSTDSLMGSNPDEWYGYNPYDIRDGDK